MTFVPRKWQKECGEKERQHRDKNIEKVFFIEACPGAGKSSMAAMIAKDWLQDGFVDHVVILAPWKPIIEGIEEACIKLDLSASKSLFYGTGVQLAPRHEVTVLTMAAGCKSTVIQAFRHWRETEGLRFGIIIDEIHHASIAGSWGIYLAELGEDAERVTVMSGTPFRNDAMPIQFLSKALNNKASLGQHCLKYPEGVSEGYVRNVTTRWIQGDAKIKNQETGEVFEKPYSELTQKEILDCQDQLYDSRGELVRRMIESIDADLMRQRKEEKYKDAAALFVCRPGKDKSKEDKRVYQIARRIEAITGHKPEVVTHTDKDAVGKIRAFRNGDAPYIVAVNMISEGCDIPRIMSVGFLRYMNSEMLFRQVVGRAIRRRGAWDDVAAATYMPKFNPMAAWAELLYEEAESGMRTRKSCDVCGQVPCCCCKVCQHCGLEPCDCPKCTECHRKVWSCSCDSQKKHLLLDHEARAHSGFFAGDVEEKFIKIAGEIGFRFEQHRGRNHVEMGHFLQSAYKDMYGQDFNTDVSPEQKRRSMIEKCQRVTRRIAQINYEGHEGLAFSEQIMGRFAVEDFAEMKARFSMNQVERVLTHLTHVLEGGVK